VAYASLRGGRRVALRSPGEGGPEIVLRLSFAQQRSPQQRYTGFTADLKSRLRAHNAGSSTHTAKHRPWSLVSYPAFRDERKARV
jgi:hypothetical protein